MNYSKQEFLMGTDIEISISSNINPVNIIKEGFSIFDSMEKEFSRFLKTSDLNILNHKKEFECSNRFLEVFKLSQQINKVTRGYFNPLLNVSTIGYSEDFKKGIFKKIKIDHNINMNLVRVNGNIIKLEKDQNIDLGGIVKGYSVDLVKDFLIKKGYNNFFINAGGDIYTSGKIITVAIDSPYNPEDILATLDIENKSISTSGTYKRKWIIEGKKYHHIMNPDNIVNLNEIISITLISDQCYITDSYATACIAMGLDKTLLFLKNNNIDGIIVLSDGKIYQTQGMKKFNLEILGC